MLSVEHGLRSMDKLTIRITRQVSERDWKRLMTWREHVFSTEGLGTDWIGGGMHVLASSDTEAVGHIGFDTYPLIVDGVETECIGIGAVVVVPEHQGRGIPKQMLACLNEWRAGNSPDTAMALFCTKSLVPYYTKHSFTECMQEVFYIQKETSVRSKFSFMVDRSFDGKKRIEIPSNPW